MHVLAVIIATMFSAWNVQPATQGGAPFDIINMRLNDRGDVECDLMSAAPSAATAWRVEVRIVQPDGSLRRHSAVTVDSFLIEAQRGVIPDAEIDAKFLRPSFPYRLIIPGRFAGSPILIAQTMVLGDGTAFGDPGTIDQIFARRRLERDAREQILTQLRAVQQSRRGLEALNEARRRMISPSNDAPDAHIWQAVGHNLELALRPSNDKIDPDARLAAVVGLVEREYRVAAQQSVKR